MRRKLPIQEIPSDIVGFQCLCHPAVRIGFADWTGQAIFPHETLDFLDVHLYRLRQMEQAHMDSPNALIIATKPIYLQNQLKIRAIL